MNVKKAVYITIGCISLALGTIGSFLPILPTVPFLLLAAFCFGKSSDRLHKWFTSTQLYKKNLQSYVEGKGMTKKTKLRIMGTVSLIMAIGFVCMFKVPVGQICLGVVWVCHVIYFVWGIKTITEEEAAQYTDVAGKK